MSAPDTQLVPLGDAWADRIEEALAIRRPGLAREFRRLHDAAPADPVATLDQWFHDHFTLDDYDSDHRRDIALSVLAALGCVSARETNEKPA